ncbi:MAG: LysM peptidoglycan-binding domain-containing protein [Bacteroidota bacterium]
MFRTISIVLAMYLLTVGIDYAEAQEKMSKEEWQSQITEFTAKRNQLKSQLDQLNSEISGLKARISEFEAAIQRCKDETYALVKVTDAEIQAFDRELRELERRVEELSRMSDEQLLKNKSELDKISSALGELGESKIGVLPEFYDRIVRLENRIAALRKSLVGKEKVYTVGTWKRDRDCLWNIAKKKDIYDNAWRWPKIWQGNRDQIKDPDLIYPGQKLKIPSAAPLTAGESKAANAYYQKKAAMTPEITE